MGYFDKMAKSDSFILLDAVQLEKGSYMYRNRIINAQGKVAFLTVSGEKHGYLDRSYNEILSTNDAVFLEKQRGEIMRAYMDSPYFSEVWGVLKDLFETQEKTICAYCVRSIVRVRQLLGIPTELIMQSDLPDNPSMRKNDLVLYLCQTVGATGYLSGNGAKKYMDEASFENAGITLCYQSYEQPVYSQLHTKAFVPGLSILDYLFNCGIERSREVFWKNISTGKS